MARPSKLVKVEQTATRKRTDCNKPTELHPSKKLIIAELKKAPADATEYKIHATCQCISAGFRDRKMYPPIIIKGNTIHTIRLSQEIVKRKKEDSFQRCLSSPIKIFFSPNFRYANSWAENCNTMVVKPKSAKIDKAAKPLNVYQYPCSIGVKKNGIASSITGPEITRHNELIIVFVKSLFIFTFTPFQLNV